MRKRCGSTRWQHPPCRIIRRSGSRRRSFAAAFRWPSTAPTSRGSFSPAMQLRPTVPSRRPIISGSTLRSRLPSMIPRARSCFSRARFRLESGSLKDSAGNPVELTLITNSGNTAREKMATMIQQDLSQIGITMKVVTLDFPSLIERITRTFDYEACLLGLVNTDLDPNGQLTVWLSSGENHQWNPNQRTPVTAWEAEIDKLMREQASLPSEKLRKSKFDRVQQIVAEQQPFIYLVNKNALSAVASDILGASPVALNPQAFWNVETLRLKTSREIGASK